MAYQQEMILIVRIYQRDREVVLASGEQGGVGCNAELTPPSRISKTPGPAPLITVIEDGGRRHVR